jgi:hypothetical protein
MEPIALHTVYDRRPAIDDLPGRRRASFPEIVGEEFWDLYEASKPYSLSNIPGFFNLYQSLLYIERSGVAGDFVEFGSFLGGCGIFAAQFFERRADNRKIIVFDTFEGFPPGQQDVMSGKVVGGVRYPSFLQAVKDNYASVVPGFSSVEFVAGAVEDVLPSYQFTDIALMRLDTDFYLSTKAELEYGYPALVSGGVIIIDDYGMFEGARRAADEYFSSVEAAPLLNRINTSIWAGVKP